MGLKPMPVRRFQEYAEQVRGLLQGEDVLYREGKNERWIRLLQHDFNGYLNIQDPIPLYFAAQGPRMLALTGEMADGLITAVVGMATTDQQQETIRASMAAVRAGAQAAGRQLDDSYYLQITACGCVLREGESLLSPRVVERVGPFGLLSAHATWEAQHGLQDAVSAEFSRHTPPAATTTSTSRPTPPASARPRIAATWTSTRGTWGTSSRARSSSSPKP